MRDLELAVKYSPYILFDKAEPFEVDGIGITVFSQPGRESPSFRRIIDFEPEKVAFAIEYAVYFDYDIQHMYDLEHIWIYVDHQGRVCDAEASFHGFYMKSMALGNNVIRDGTHLEIYCQPGKHAFMPEARLFKLIPDWYSACNVLAGTEGLLVVDMFKDRLSITPECQKQVQQYIRSHYSFEPTLQFEYRPLKDSLFILWDELKAIIPARIEKELTKIQNSSK